MCREAWILKNALTLNFVHQVEKKVPPKMLKWSSPTRFKSAMNHLYVEISRIRTRNCQDVFRPQK